MNFLDRCERQKRFITVNANNLLQQTKVCKRHPDGQHDSGTEFLSQQLQPGVAVPPCKKTTNISKAWECNILRCVFETSMRKGFASANLAFTWIPQERSALGTFPAGRWGCRRVGAGTVPALSQGLGGRGGGRSGWAGRRRGPPGRPRHGPLLPRLTCMLGTKPFLILQQFLLIFSKNCSSSL